MRKRDLNLMEENEGVLKWQNPGTWHSKLERTELKEDDEIFKK